MRAVKRKFCRGYTLVEVLMVVFIIAMLASLVTIRYDRQRRQTAVNVTKSNLESIRTSIALFYEAEGMYPTSDLSDLVSGSPSGAKYLGAIPAEAINNKNVVVNIPTYNGGWVYETGMHTVRPNLLGNDINGNPYSSY